MGQISFKCPRSGQIKDRFPDPECWTCTVCSEEGNRLFKAFVVDEVEKGHIYHRLRPDPDPAYSNNDDSGSGGNVS